VLQDFEFEPVGGTRTQRADVRCILATNEDLDEAVRRGDFRQDLYWRVNVVTIHLPPLRQRIGDIPLLAEHFLDNHCRRTERKIMGFQDDAMRLLQGYGWPGNVRQLENVIERAVILTKNATLAVDDLPENMRRPAGGEGGDGQILPLKKALEKPEREIILRVLSTFQGSRQATAEALGINRTTLYKKMKRYSIKMAEA
jgi:DNA-binding NtrC family response regulator